MSAPEKTSGLIGVSRIAEIADVRASAVSNWRRRHKDFPKARAGSGRETMFDLDEVEAWLLDNEKIDERISPVLRVLAILDAARIDESRSKGSGTVVTGFFRAALVYLIACRRSGESDLSVPVKVATKDSWSSIREDPDVLETLAEAAMRIESSNENLQGMLGSLISASQEPLLRDLAPQLIEILDESLDSGLSPLRFLDLVEENEVRRDPRRASSWVTPESLIKLFKALAPDAANQVLDPAAGSGRLLAEVSEQVGASEAFAAEITESTELAVRQRLFLADIRSEVSGGSSLEREDWPKVNLVVIDPPLSLKRWGRPEDYGSPRWKFGPPPPGNADLAWVQVGVLPLRKGGTGIVITPPGALFRGGREATIRRHLLQAGVVEAVISLPPGLLASTQIPLAMWILRSAESAQPDAPVLMIDARSLSSLAEDSPIQQIAQMVKEWRDECNGAAPDPSGTQVASRFRELAATVAISELGKDFVLAPSRYLLTSEIDAKALRGQHERVGKKLLATGSLGVDPGLLTLPRIGQVERRELGEVAQILKGHTRLEPEDDFTKQVLEEKPDDLGRQSERMPRNWVPPTKGLDESWGFLLSAPRRVWNWQAIEREFLKGDEEQALPGDVAVVFDQVGSQGVHPRTKLLRDDRYSPVIPGAGIWLIRSHDPDELLPGWIARFVASESFRNQLQRLDKPGLLTSNISLDEFEAIEIPIPPVEGQKQLVEKFGQLEAYQAQAARAARNAEVLGGMLFDLTTAEAETGDED